MLFNLEPVQFLGAPLKLPIRHWLSRMAGSSYPVLYLGPPIWNSSLTLAHSLAAAQYDFMVYKYTEHDSLLLVNLVSVCPLSHHKTNTELN